MGLRRETRAERIFSQRLRGAPNETKGGHGRGDVRRIWGGRAMRPTTAAGSGLPKPPFSVRGPRGSTTEGPAALAAPAGNDLADARRVRPEGGPRPPGDGGPDPDGPSWATGQTPKPRRSGQGDGRMTSIVRFPTSHAKRLKNRLGPRAVFCLVTERWLRIGPRGFDLADGPYVEVDVMRIRDQEGQEFGASRKLCSLIILRRELEMALAHVDWSETAEGKRTVAGNNVADRVNAIVGATVDQLAAISGEGDLRVAVMKAALGEMCHRLAELEGLDYGEVADHLDKMADVLREIGD